VSPNNSVIAATAAPSAAILNSKFALDCFKRNQINRFISPIVKQAAAAVDQRIVRILNLI